MERALGYSWILASVWPGLARLFLTFYHAYNTENNDDEPQQLPARAVVISTVYNKKHSEPYGENGVEEPDFIHIQNYIAIVQG